MGNSETSSKKILCVDDEPLNLAILEAQLEDYYEIYTADSGKEGLEMLATVKPDIVLMDWMMPGMDGLQATSLIKHQSDIPVIMISAKASPSDIQYALNHGVDDYLTKPFDEDDLVAVIKKYI